MCRPIGIPFPIRGMPLHIVDATEGVTNRVGDWFKRMGYCQWKDGHWRGVADRIRLIGIA